MQRISHRMANQVTDQSVSHKHNALESVLVRWENDQMFEQKPDMHSSVLCSRPHNSCNQNAGLTTLYLILFPSMRCEIIMLFKDRFRFACTVTRVPAVSLAQHGSCSLQGAFVPPFHPSTEGPWLTSSPLGFSIDNLSAYSYHAARNSSRCFLEEASCA